MEIEQQIADAFVRFGKHFSRGSIMFEGYIWDVNETDFTCVVNVQTPNTDGSSSNVLVPNVPLKMLTGSQPGVVEIPKKSDGLNYFNSCLMCFRDNNIQRPQLIWAQDIDKYLLKINDKTLQVDTNGFVFNGGTNDGMVLVNALVTKLNIIENDLNTLKTIFGTGWVVVAGDGGAALKAASTTWAGASITDTTKDDIQNINIKQ